MMIVIRSKSESRRAGMAIVRGFWCDADFSFPAQMLHFVQHDNLVMG